jgi:hypothetical protein
MAFAQTGDASQIHPFSSNSEGLPSCPTPNIYATVSPAVTGRQLQADESAFFVEQNFENKPCQAALFVFHNASENNGSGHTAGRVFLSPNSSGPAHNLEVAAGDVSDPDSFNFNF